MWNNPVIIARFDLGMGSTERFEYLVSQNGRMDRFIQVATALVLTAIVITASVQVGRGTEPASADSHDIHPDWTVPPGFQIKVDTSGYDSPAAIAFVPEPGPDPDYPLYYVAELAGTIKVVTNDRQVQVFARDLDLFEPDFNERGQIGLAGL